MRRRIEAQEPERDRALADALRPLYPESPLDDEALRALRARIRAAARAPGQEEARSATWGRATHLVGLRRRYALPALLAATLAGILLVRQVVRTGGPTTASAPATAARVADGVGFSSAEQALAAPLSDADFARVLTLQNDPAALLAIAVGAAPQGGAR